MTIEAGNIKEPSESEVSVKSPNAVWAAANLNGDKVEATPAAERDISFLRVIVISSPIIFDIRNMFGVLDQKVNGEHFKTDKTLSARR